MGEKPFAFTIPPAPCEYSEQMTVTVLSLLACLSPLVSEPRIEDYVQSGLKDASFVAKVIRADQRELKKINEDFGRSYRFNSTHIMVMEPFKLRIETTIEDSKVTYILNGVKQEYRAKGLSVPVQNLSHAPGRRQTMLDFGLLTPSLFETLFNAVFVRVDRTTGDLVFDVSYKDKDDDVSHHRIWVDKKKRIVTKREWYNQANRQIATFYYENPVNIEGIWIPTRLTVKNVEDKVAGVTGYDAIKVNSGLSSSLFTTR